MKKTEEKKRTIDAVDQEYTGHAAQAGHKARLITEHESMIEGLEAQVKTHFARMKELGKEADQLRDEKAAAVKPAVDAGLESA